MDTAYLYDRGVTRSVAIMSLLNNALMSCEELQLKSQAAAVSEIGSMLVNQTLCVACTVTLFSTLVTILRNGTISGSFAATSVLFLKGKNEVTSSSIADEQLHNSIQRRVHSMATMFGLPMIKLGGLVVRTLTKPLAKVVKSRSKVHPGLNYVCNRLGQGQHRLMIKFHMGFRGIHKYNIKDIPEDQAVEKGADLMGELLIFSVAVAVASYEYTRSSAKSKETERKNDELKRRAEQELEARFEHLEAQVIWLEGKLAELGHIVEHDLDKRIEEAVNAAAIEQIEDDLQQLERRRRREPTSAHVGIDLDDSSLSVSASSSVWSVTYDTIAGLFR